MNDINKLKLPDDWAEGYESPITLALQEIANKITIEIKICEEKKNDTQD